MANDKPDAGEAARRIVEAADNMNGSFGADRRAALKRLNAAMRDEYGIIQCARALLSSSRRIEELEKALAAADIVNKLAVQKAQNDASLHGDNLYRDYMTAESRKLDEAFQTLFGARAALSPSGGGEMAPASPSRSPATKPSDV